MPGGCGGRAGWLWFQILFGDSILFEDRAVTLGTAGAVACVIAPGAGRAVPTAHGRCKRAAASRSRGTTRRRHCFSVTSASEFPWVCRMGAAPPGQRLAHTARRAGARDDAGTRAGRSGIPGRGRTPRHPEIGAVAWPATAPVESRTVRALLLGMSPKEIDRQIDDIAAFPTGASSSTFPCVITRHRCTCGWRCRVHRECAAPDGRIDRAC